MYTSGRVVKAEGLRDQGLLLHGFESLRISMQNTSRIPVPWGESAWEHLSCSCSPGVISLAGKYTYAAKIELGVTDPHEQDPRAKGPAWQSVVQL